ncbi:MAG: radical SAM family heme chaperone HemW [Oscillospiraceae bacterium]|nr:radical SAM family heme chaperone HemW [Oscillospiraceae bacterium]
MDPIGVYLHIPFCRAKCPYCDFYSLPGADDVMDRYTDALCARIRAAAALYPRRAATLYFGGGTPSLLGAARLCKIIACVREVFPLDGAEITLEANPGAVTAGELRALARAGVNRVSLGLQSAAAEELAFLGRQHTLRDVENAVSWCRAAGIENISLDLMLGLPRQTKASLLRSIEYCAGLGVPHLSAYLLKIEPGTPFALRHLEALCPDEDGQAELYLFAVEELEKRGWRQYEISNFSRPGLESRHNLIYWDCREYLGLGPGAHSFIEGNRWFYPRDLSGFLALSGPEMAWEPEGPGGEFEEYAMLRLRLTEGLVLPDAAARFPGGAAQKVFDRSEPYQKAGYLRREGDRLFFSPRGFLVSNSILARILEG